MNIFHDEHIALLKVILKHDVNFILVGGVAVNFYGYSRPTGDLDVWLQPTESNKNKLVGALRELEIFSEDIELISKSDFTAPLAFHIGSTPPFVIDFLTKITGVNWDEAWEMRFTEKIDNLSIPFIHFTHLKQNKMISGRAKDLNDLSQLLRIEELRKNKKI